MTQFTATITRHIVRCGPVIDAKVEILFAPGVALDSDQRYLLYSSGMWATSDITSSLNAMTGASTALSAESTDATATVVSNIISSAASVSKIVATVAPFSIDKKTLRMTTDVGELCNEKTSDIVKELYPAEGSGQVPLKRQVDDATAQLEIATAQVTLAASKLAVDKENASLKTALLDALTNQEARRSNLSTLQKRFTGHVSHTTDTQVTVWPRRGTEYRSDAIEMGPEVFKKWANKDLTLEEGRAFTRAFVVSLALYRQEPSGAWTPGENVKFAPVNTDKGVPVRLPVRARLLACTGKDAPSTELAERQNVEGCTAQNVPVLQLSQIYVVPVTGGLFKSEVANISLDANGAPTSIRVQEKVAAMASLSETAKEAAKQLAALPAEIAAAELAKTKAQTEQLNANAALATAQASAGQLAETTGLAAQTALITAQNNLATAQANAGQIQTNAVAAQTALLNAQAALANAQANAQNVEMTSALGAQASLINAQAALVNAAAALARARAGG